MARKKKEVNTNYKSESERKNALKEALKEINKEHGETLVKLASEEKPKETLSTGIKAIDEFLGGGWVKGNYSVIYGKAGSGKTTFALQSIANAQKEGKICCLIDMERSFDLVRAEQLGVDLKELVLIENCDTAEQALDIIIDLSKKKVMDFCVLDSIQALSPKGEQETKTGKQKSIEDDTMALLARKLGQFFRQSSSAVYKGNVAVLLIGQVRTTGLGTFVVKDGLSGGMSVLHWPYQIIYIRKGQAADSPQEDYLEEIDTPDGIVKKKRKRPCGFDCVLHLQKSKSSTSKPEGTQIHVPFYFVSGFIHPKEIWLEKNSEAKKMVEKGIQDAKEGNISELKPKKKKRGRPKKEK